MIIFPTPQIATPFHRSFFTKTPFAYHEKADMFSQFPAQCKVIGWHRSGRPYCAWLRQAHDTRSASLYSSAVGFCKDFLEKFHRFCNPLIFTGSQIWSNRNGVSKFRNAVSARRSPTCERRNWTSAGEMSKIFAIQPEAGASSPVLAETAQKKAVHPGGHTAKREL